MKNEAPLDTLEAITTRYHDVLINHAIHHSGHHLNNALLYPLHQRMDADHSIAANHDVFLAESLGKDTKTALYKFYIDLVEQLDKIRKTNFTDDHEEYSGAGYPERGALNPQKGKHTATLPDLIGKAREMTTLLDPNQEAPASQLEIQKHRKAISDLARTIGSLHRRYENALTPPPGKPPLLESRRELLEYSRDLVETMHHVTLAGLGAQRDGVKL